MILKLKLFQHNNYICEIAKKYNLEIVEIKNKGTGNTFDFAV